MQVHSKAFDVLSGPAGTLKTLSGPPLMSFLEVALTGSLYLMEKHFGGLSKPHEAEYFRDQVQSIFISSLLCAENHCTILSSGWTNGW